MTDFNNIPAAGPLDGTDEVIILQAGQPVRALLWKVLTFTPGTATADPTAFAATPIDDANIDLDWTAAGDNYILERSPDESSWQEIYNGATASFSDTDLYPDNTYNYRVKSQETGYYDSDWVYVDGTTPALP